jgi:hypothetical protein
MRDPDRLVAIRQPGFVQRYEGCAWHPTHHIEHPRIDDTGSASGGGELFESSNLVFARSLVRRQHSSILLGRVRRLPLAPSIGVWARDVGSRVTRSF